MIVTKNCPNCGGISALLKANELLDWNWTQGTNDCLRCLNCGLRYKSDDIEWEVDHEHNAVKS